MSSTASRALNVLLALTSQLTDDRPLEDFLKAVTDAVLDLIAADHASIRLLDTARVALLSGARSGTGEVDRPMGFRAGEGVLGWVVDHGQPVRIDDVESDSRWLKYPGQALHVRSMMAEPLWSSGEVIGVLSVSAPEIAAFSDEHQLLLRLLANCSAPPIERARLRRLAMFDDLTMAYNHRYLAPRLVEEMARATRAGNDVSVLYMDLDHFKRVNDQHGHATGDRVLRRFADCVRKAVRPVDVLVRRGGEEFVLIMPGTAMAQAAAVGERIRHLLADDALVIEGSDTKPSVTLRHTVSIGVATWEPPESAQDLENRADRAMYEAKRLGRDRVVVSSPTKVYAASHSAVAVMSS